MGKLRHLRRLGLSRTPTNLGTILDVLPKDAAVPQEFYEDDDRHVYGAAITKETIVLWKVDIEKYGIWHFSNLKTIFLPPAEFPGRTIEDALDEAWQDGAWN